jgi:hypothetical protein
MQLLPHSKLKATTEQLQTALQDIAHKLEIQSHHYISHPDYKPLELPPEVIARFQKLPSDVQSKYLNLQLRNFLYGIYYNASLKRVLALDTETTNLELNNNLENNTFLGVDVEFYNRLHQSNSGEGYFSLNWQVVREEADGTLAVHKEGLTLHIERDRHLQPQDQSANTGDLVSIKMPKNLVQNGFYMAVGNQRTNHRSDRNNNTVRVYFNLTPEGSVVLMSSITAQLNAISISFDYKTLYNPQDYGRYDSAVLYFDKHNYHTVHPVLEKIYKEHQSHFQPEVPLFTKQIAPGLAIAEEPNRKFADRESFGQNRCQIVAHGLLEAWHQGNDSPENRMALIRKHFDLQKIDWQYSYLNPRSEDIYRELRL